MEIFGSGSASEATKKAVLAPAKLLGETPVEAAVDLLKLKNPIPGIQENVRGAVGDLALWPFRFTGHVLAGGTKTLLKLGWSAVINSPIVPVGNNGRAFLADPGSAIRRFNGSLSAGDSPLKAFRKMGSQQTPPAQAA